MSLTLPRCASEELLATLTAAPRLQLFLDYDGTLADFAPTPENPTPDQAVTRLLARLVAAPHIRVALVSGRRLDHLEQLVPVPGVLLAGAYGIELRLADGRLINRLEYDRVRPPLTALKPQWAGLLAGRKGFFLEDKGWSLALHARFADDAEAEAVLAQARDLAGAALAARDEGELQLLGGNKFLEIAPALADKGLAVAHLLQQFPWAGALPVYVGDDDKDEKAFAVIRAQGGLTAVVAAQPRPTLADCRLPSPRAARAWLSQLARRGG